MGRVKVEGKVTLQLVAERAGVSVATASRALAGRGQVSPTTVAAVTRAATQLGYRTAPAPAPAPGDGQRVAVVTAGLNAQFVDQILEGVNDAADGSIQGCVVATTQGDPTRELGILRDFLADPTVSGAIVTGGRWSHPETAEQLAALAGEFARAGKPLVFCGRPALPGGLPRFVVDYDNVGGARAAGAYLLSLGHRDILFVRGPLGFTTSDARADGVREAFAEFGMAWRDDLVKIGQRDRRTGYDGVTAALAAGAEFTAVLGECDLIAAGAMAALADRDIRVPDEVSVIGFDNMLLSQDLRVPLTTVEVPFREIGRSAARLALGPDQPNREDHQMAGTHLVVRDSVRHSPVRQRG